MFIAQLLVPSYKAFGRANTRSSSGGQPQLQDQAYLFRRRGSTPNIPIKRTSSFPFRQPELAIQEEDSSFENENGLEALSVSSYLASGRRFSNVVGFDRSAKPAVFGTSTSSNNFELSINQNRQPLNSSSANCTKVYASPTERPDRTQSFPAPYQPLSPSPSVRLNRTGEVVFHTPSLSSYDTNSPAYPTLTIEAPSRSLGPGYSHRQRSISTSPSAKAKGSNVDYALETNRVDLERIVQGLEHRTTVMVKG